MNPISILGVANNNYNTNENYYKSENARLEIYNIY